LTAVSVFKIKESESSHKSKFLLDFEVGNVDRSSLLNTFEENEDSVCAIGDRGSSFRCLGRSLFLSSSTSFVIVTASQVA